MLKNKSLVVVLGMHRTGTSVLSRCLSELGYEFSENLMPSGNDNPKGFWEDIDVVRLNDKLLNDLGCTWDKLFFRLNSENVDDLENRFSEAVELLSSKFTLLDRLILKDPRITVLLPFWVKVFEALNVSVKYILANRSPMDVSTSLATRNGFHSSKSLNLWLFYNIFCIESLAHDDDFLVVNYGDLLTNFGCQIERLSLFLDEGIKSKEELKLFETECVDQELCHSSITLKEMEGKVPSYVYDLAAILDSNTKKSNTTSIKGEIEHYRLKNDRHILAAQEKYILDESRSTVKELNQLCEQHEEANERIKINQYELTKSEKELNEYKDELTQLSLHLNKLDEELEGNGKLIKRQEKDLLDRSLHIEKLDTELVDKAELIHEQEKNLSERSAHINKLELDLAEKIKLIQVKEDDLSARLSEINSLNDKLLANSEELSEHSDEILVLKGRVEEKSKIITEYDQHSRDVTSSVSFKLGRILTYPIRKPVVKWLVPHCENHSRLELFINLTKILLLNPLKLLGLFNVRRIKNVFILFGNPSLAKQVVNNYKIMMEDDSNVLPKYRLREYSAEDLNSFDLEFPVFSKPLVSVIVPVYNQLLYTLNCLESIKRHEPNVTYEVIVADDGSADDTEKVLSQVPGLIYKRNPENLGFLRSCNRAVDFAKGKYVFLLNNDTIVTPGWLDELLVVYDDKPDAGIVGSRLIYPDGSLQEAGGIVWRDASGWNYGRNAVAELPEYNYLKEVDYVSGAAILFPRALFNAVGRFDDEYAPAYYEDTDIAFTFRAAGKKVYLQPKSNIVHFEGISNGTDTEQGIKQHQVVNQARFRAKWKHVLDTEHYPNAENVFLARDRSTKKTTVLIIDHYVPHFDQDAGSKSTFLYIKLMVNHGFNVKFIGDNFFKHEPYTSVLESLGVEVLYGNDYALNWKAWIKENAAMIDVIYMHRPHISERYIDFINELPKKPKTIYFGHDLHYLRLQRQYEVEGNKDILLDSEKWKKKEWSLFSKFDQIYYPSSFEVDEIKSVDDINVKAIPLYVLDGFIPGRPEQKNRDGLLFVGGFNHPPNTDAIVWFCKEVLPLVVTSEPDVILHVVGSNAPSQILSLAGKNVVVHGFVSDEELSTLYDSIKLSVVPLRYGAGVKGKVLEAMDKGVPVVTTEVGAEGIPDKYTCLGIADDPIEMAKLIVKTYNDTEQSTRLVNESYKVIQECFSERAVLKVIENDFKVV